MILNTLTKKSVLAIFIACGGVIWLNEWHQYGYSSTELIFPSVSSWLRDSMIVLIPVLLAVWFGLRLAQWIIDRIDHKLSPSTQAILAATLLGGATSLAFLLIENNQIILTGISTELAFIVSICRNLYSDGNVLLSALLWAFPGYLAIRYHILLQDGFYLALVNMTITIFLMFILEGVAGVGNSRNHKKRV